VRVLFLHSHFPGHYAHLAPALAAAGHRVVFATRQAGARMPGVDVRVFAPHRDVSAATHPYLRAFEDAVLQGQAAYRLCRTLRAEGFVPDVVCAHAGFGPGLYVKEAFPEAALLAYFEWFYRSADSDCDFLGDPVSPDDACRIASLNAGILIELAACDRGICPTAFQLSRFPPAFADRIALMHDGIDTDLFAPDPAARMVLPGLDLSGAAEVVTYATRGMEPYRGFPQFMRAADRLLRDRPGLHVVVGGADGVFYGPRRTDGRTWKQAMLEELPGLDRSRLHFVGPLGTPDWRRLLQATSAHVYLSVPFVLSWSLIEAMAAGAPVVGSDTAPVREAVGHGTEGLLADFHDPDAVADAVSRLLDDRALAARLGRGARARALARYRLADLLPRQIRLIRMLAEGRRGADATDFEALSA